MLNHHRIPWRTKLLLLLLVFALVPAAALAMIAFDTMDRTSQDSTLDGLEALARAKADAIDQFTDTRRRDVERMAELISPQFQELRLAEDALKRSTDHAGPPSPPPQQLDDAQAIGPDGTPRPVPAPQPKKHTKSSPPPAEPSLDPVQRQVDSARAALSRKLGLLLWDQGAFEELIVIDRSGIVQASTFSEHVGKTAAAIDYFDRGRRATYVQPVFMSPITNELTMVIATPIRDDSNTDIGVLAVRLNLKRFFLLINDNTGLGKTGETVVGKKIGDEVVLMAPTRHDADAALKRKIKLGAPYAHAIQEAASGDTGSGVVRDYRGKQVFAAWREAPAIEWGIVTKLDMDEAEAPVLAARMHIFGLTLVVAIFVVIASIVAARALVRPLGELKEATDKISKGDFDVELDIRSGDEIGELADSFERMVAAIKYFRETSREPRAEAEDHEPPARPSRS